MKKNLFFNILLIFTLFTSGFLKNNFVSAHQSEDADAQIAFFYKIQPDFNISQTLTSSDDSTVINNEINDYSDWVTISETSELITTEAGGTDTFTVVLNSQPTADVTIGVSSDDLTEGTVSTSSLTFTPGNWDTPQLVTVTGVDDDIDDDDQSYNIILANSESDDPNFNDLDLPDVSVTNIDDDKVGVNVTPTSGLTTTEAGGIDTFTVVLNSQPTANVTIGLSSNDLTEGTVSPPSLTFTTGNWDTPQTVTVTGVNDDIDDGNQIYSIILANSVSTDPVYNDIELPNVSVTNMDNDTAGVTVTPTSGLITTEDGGQDNFSVKLATQPTQDFVLSVISSDSTEGVVDKPTLTFTTENWNINQVVTVTGIDDNIVDGPIDYTIQLDGSSGAPEYMNLGAVFVQIQNQDNDTAGVIVTPGDLTTTENGGTAQFTVSLSTQPSSPVSINLNSSDTSEGRIIDPVDPMTVILDSTNWSIGVVVTIQGQNDNIDDGDQLYAIEFSNTVSSDPNYDGIVIPDKNVTNIDNDTAGITITDDNLITGENGQSDTFGIYLNSEPTHDVTINISGWDSTEGSISADYLVFTPSNYSTSQTVIVTGVDDDYVDGNQNYQINLSASSSDPNYNIDIPNISVTNEDDDIAGISIDPSDTTMLTSEDKTTAQFTVVLDARPYGTVTIPVTSSDTSEGTVSPISLTFTNSNWNVPQEVTVTGVDDDLQDGTKDYTIELGGTSISDVRDTPFLGLSKSVNASNSDNDTAGIFITQTDGLVTSETGQIAQFSLKLNTQPLSNVTVHLISSDEEEGIITFPKEPHQLVFTTLNWSDLQQVTITGVDDVLADGDQTYQITITVTSAGTDYNNLLVSPVNIVNLDDDFSPVAQEDTYYINGEVLVVEVPGVLINDSDENGDTLTAVIQTSPAHAASFELLSDGSFTYQAESDFEGIDTFTYKAYDDGDNYSDETTVYINVDKTPPPVAEWISPVENDNLFQIDQGTVLLIANPTDESDFSHLWYAWYDPSLTGEFEDHLVDLGSAYTKPYSVTMDVKILDVDYNHIFVYVYDKAGNRSQPPTSRIVIERLPMLDQFDNYIYLPIINK